MTLLLGPPPERYDPTYERARNQEMERADAENLKWRDTPKRTTRSVRSITSSTSAGDADDVLLVDATSGAVTVTLPAASSRLKELCVKKIDSSANAVTIDGSGSETIDDATTLVLASQYDAVRIMSDGTEWWIL